ncbi:hypothetical protein KO500_10930 [Cellulophaga baltica]|uniref:hypothetical protein n=1 Tax=Cellulophaga TaxID=104264 RepID=UPI001C065A83|nr:MULTISPECIES: hypothetical protein [Cellulophaga]MBU2996953.1 hypothetical protein [Cellulophaga baltica]MDO6768351.1 hypothetical protein [Cellulophaga sp. 1_MG-2023]
MKNNLIYGLLVITSFLISCNETKKEVNAPDQIISISEAKLEYDNYTEKRAKLIELTEEPYEDGSSFVASRYGDYDIETIKNYIAYVEQEAKEAGVKIETLRFYFSTYPNKKDFPDKKEVKHPRQNSFFILPTMRVDTFNYGFYIKNLGDEKKEAALIRDYPEVINNESGVIQDQTTKSHATLTPSLNINSNKLFSEDESLIINKGNMGPPPNNSDFN